MKKSNRSIKRKGFTLVELLIVIVVIGILSAMMMLSSTEAVTSAKASNIVSNLRNLKTAALALYVDSLDAYSVTTGYDNPNITQVIKYMSSSNTISGTSGYFIVCKGNPPDKEWYVGYGGTNAGDFDGAAVKLAGRSKSVGLVGLASAPADKADITDTPAEFKATDKAVLMKVR